MLGLKTWTEQCRFEPSWRVAVPSADAARAGRAMPARTVTKHPRKTGNLAGLAVTQNGVECNSMPEAAQWLCTTVEPLPKPTFCEEVFVNASGRDFIAQSDLNTSAVASLWRQERNASHFHGAQLR